MDPTRLEDIKTLRAALKNPDVPEIRKRQAYKSLEQIYQQEALPWLHEERMRLRRARLANDQEAADYISYSIKRRMQEENV